MYGGGIGSLMVSSNIADDDGTAWAPVWTKEGEVKGKAGRLQQFS
jgi:hypothetical protein